MIEGSKLWLTLTELTAHLNEDESKAFKQLAKDRCSQSKGLSWISRPYITPTSKIQIDFDSIPSQSRLKYSLPSKDIFINQEIAASKAEITWNTKQVEAARSGLFSAMTIDPDLSAWYLNRFSGLQFANRNTFKTLINDLPQLAARMIKLTLILDFNGRYYIGCKRC
jgi:hypothetical protein